MSTSKDVSLATQGFDLLLVLAPWVGIAAAIAAVIANSVFKSPEWAFYFVAGSALGMWASFLHLARELKGHIAENRAYLELAGKHRLLIEKLVLDKANQQDEEKLPILLVLRSPFLKNSGIDDVFWARYCKYLLDDIDREDQKTRNLVAKAEQVQQALRDRKVVADVRWAYQLMKDLFEDVVRPGGDPYKGVFTEADRVSVIDIEELVFNLPLRSQRGVRRIFALPRDRLKSLPLPHREQLLKQLNEGHIELRILTNPPADLPNVGIYGGTAYGELDPKIGVNTFHFDRDRVNGKLREFSDLWEKSTKLTAADLGLP